MDKITATKPQSIIPTKKSIVYANYKRSGCHRQLLSWKKTNFKAEIDRTISIWSTYNFKETLYTTQYERNCSSVPQDFSFFLQRTCRCQTSFCHKHKLKLKTSTLLKFSIFFFFFPFFSFLLFCLFFLPFVFLNLKRVQNYKCLVTRS